MKDESMEEIASEGPLKNIISWLQKIIFNNLRRSNTVEGLYYNWERDNQQVVVISKSNN